MAFCPARPSVPLPEKPVVILGLASAGGYIGICSFALVSGGYVVGNIGQLAVDCLLATLTAQERIVRVGYIESDALTSIIGRKRLCQLFFIYN